MQIPTEYLNTYLGTHPHTRARARHTWTSGDSRPIGLERSCHTRALELHVDIASAAPPSAYPYSLGLPRHVPLSHCTLQLSARLARDTLGRPIEPWKEGIVRPNRKFHPSSLTGFTLWLGSEVAPAAPHCHHTHIYYSLTNLSEIDVELESNRAGPAPGTWHLARTTGASDCPGPAIVASHLVQLCNWLKVPEVIRNYCVLPHLLCTSFVRPLAHLPSLPTSTTTTTTATTSTTCT